jgi:general secretion pathway protein C
MWITRHHVLRVLPSVVTLLFGLGTVWQLSEILRSVIESPENAPPPQPLLLAPAPGIGKQPPALSSAVDTIVRAHLFGVASPPTRSLASRPASQRLQDSSLPLTLLGVLSSADDSSAGQAVIVDRTGHAAIYRVGEIVDERATLVAIHPVEVHLQHNGELERLLLVSFASSGDSPSSEAGLRSRSSEPPPELQAMLNTLENEPVMGGPTLDDLFRARPVFEDRKLRGYRVQPGRLPSGFAQLGLQSEDLVVKINGQPARSFTHDLIKLRQLELSIPVEVTVERSGVQVSMVLDPAGINAQSPK